MIKKETSNIPNVEHAVFYAYTIELDGMTLGSFEDYAVIRDYHNISIIFTKLELYSEALFHKFLLDEEKHTIKEILFSPEASEAKGKKRTIEYNNCKIVNMTRNITTNSIIILETFKVETRIEDVKTSTE